MNRPLRVIDTGIGEARRNIAFDQALIELHESGEIPATLRFLRFRPSVLIGRHQSLHREVDVDYCRAHGIELARRVTGGGALYFDERQLGWELVCRRHELGVSALTELTRTLCTAAASGLARLGIPVRFRPRNDLEVDGRKLGGTGGFFVGDTLFFQGTVLLELETAVMFSALRVPGEKRARRVDAAPSARVVDLRELLGQAMPSPDQVQEALVAGFAELGFVPRRDETSALEWQRAASLHREEFGRDEFVAEIDEPDAGGGSQTATRLTAGGAVTASVRLARGREARLAATIISGDFFVTPPRVIFDLEAALKDVSVAAVPAAVNAFFEQSQPDFLSLSPADIAGTIVDAAARALAPI